MITNLKLSIILFAFFYSFSLNTINYIPKNNSVILASESQIRALDQDIESETLLETKVSNTISFSYILKDKAPFEEASIFIKVKERLYSTNYPSTSFTGYRGVALEPQRVIRV